MSDLAKILENIESEFESFKKLNDQRLDEIEKNGRADPLLEEKVNKANKAISDLQNELQNEQNAAKNRMDELEKLMNRPGAGGSVDQQNLERDARVLYAMKNNVPVNEVEIDLEEYKAYRDAYGKYLRRGDEHVDYSAALSVGSNPDGGVWVSPDNSDKIATLVYETTPMRQVADIQNTGSDEIEGFNDLDESSSGWVGETEPRTDTTTPKSGKWKIPVHEIYAQPVATQKVLDDAFLDPEAWLNKKVASRFSRQENAAFITGDGQLKPRGILTYPAGTPSKTAWDVIEQVNSGAAGAFAASNPGDKLIDLVFKLKAMYREGAVWMCARSTVAEVRKLKDGQGNYLWAPEFTARQGGLLLGYPIVEGEDMPVIAANSLSMAFGNFKEGYLIADRMGIRVLRDPYTTKGKVKFYSTKRVGGDVVNFEAIKIMKFAA